MGMSSKKPGMHGGMQRYLASAQFDVVTGPLKHVPMLIFGGRAYCKIPRFWHPQRP